MTYGICKKIEITKSKNEIFVPLDNCHKGRWEKYFGSSHILRDFLVPPTSTSMMLETKWWPIYTDCWQFPEFLRNFQKDNGILILCYNLAHFSYPNHTTALQYFAIFLPILSTWGLKSLRKLEFLFHDKLQFIFDHDDGKGCV